MCGFVCLDFSFWFFSIIWRCFSFALQNRSEIIAALKRNAATEKCRLAEEVHIRKVHISGGQWQPAQGHKVLYYHHDKKVVTGGF